MSEPLEDVHDELVPQRVVVATGILLSLEQTAREELESLLPVEVLDQRIGLPMKDLRMWKVHDLLARSCSFQRQSSSISNARHLDLFIADFFGSILLLHETIASLAETPLSELTPEFGFRNTPADAANEDGLFASLLQPAFQDAGVPWRDVPVVTTPRVPGSKESKESNIRLTLMRWPGALFHTYVSTSTIVFASLLPLSPTSTAPPHNVPYIYALSHGIPLDHPGLATILYSMIARPEVMRRAFVAALLEPEHSPLQQELSKLGLALSMEMTPLTGSDSAAPEDVAVPAKRRTPPETSVKSPPSKRVRRQDSTTVNGAGSRGADVGGSGAVTSSPPLTEAGESKADEANAREEGVGADVGSPNVTITAQIERVHLRWQYGARPLASMNNLYRVPPPSPPPRHAQNEREYNGVDLPRAVSPIDLHLTAHFPPISDGKYAMTMYTYDGSTRYVIKTSRAHAEGLRGEAALLAHASDAGLSPRFLGLYEEELDEGVEKVRRVVLLMEDGGKALDREFSELSIREKKDLYAVVRALHRLGIWHDDLAPRNILVNPNDEFKICDFGRSRLHGCDGDGECEELEALRCMLELETGAVAAEGA
ncbi:hypothetical protein JCM10450v2_007087 [Rhodotorula kratochvilovae]